MGKKKVGDAGNALEELITGGLRVSFKQNQHGALEALVVLTPNHSKGFYVPTATVDALLEQPNCFYSILKSHLSDRTKLTPISRTDLQRTVIKSAHGSELDSAHRRLEVKY